MEFFSDTRIDFMKYRRLWVSASAVLVAATLILVLGRGHLNLGIDFAGGTQLTLRFVEEQEIERLRRILVGAGIEDAVIQRFGDPGDHEVIVKTPLVAGEEEGSGSRVVEALARELDGEAATIFDLNRRGAEAVAAFLLELDPDEIAAADETIAAGRYGPLAESIVEERRQRGLLSSWDELSAVEMTPETRQVLQENARLGSFTVLGAESVGPQIGSELRRKGIAAIVLSLLGMLAYIWIRFELRFGIGALVALTHDVVIVLGLFTLAGFEFDLTTVAAFLTLVGYSVNDSVVVFDRVRENLRQNRREPLVETMNRSLNDTLSRTVLTSGTTLLAVGCLLSLGGDVLRGFAFIITVGVVVGTYSSVYIASPFTLWWERTLGREARARRKAA